MGRRDRVGIETMVTIGYDQSYLRGSTACRTTSSELGVLLWQHALDLTLIDLIKATRTYTDTVASIA